MRKRFLRLLVSLISCVLYVAALGINAGATTTYTYNYDEKGQAARTQDAYLPDKTITNLELSSPDNIFIDGENLLYIADTDNRRIVVYDIELNKLHEVITYEGFSTPRGIFVTGQNQLYVADAGAKSIFVFDENRAFVRQYERPTTPTFESAFEPLKVCVDNRGNMYIVGEGVYSGIIQVSANGDFLGYFTANKTTVSLSQAFKDAFYTKEQRDASGLRIPVTFSNIYIDNESIVYTTTMGQAENGVKKHNTAGQNMFFTPSQTPMQLTDVVVDASGIIYTSSKDGLISIYTKNGESIFWFGGQKLQYDIAGTYTNLVSIAVDQNGAIWTLDKEKGVLQSFTPTEYTKLVYKAVGLFEKGKYDLAHEEWNRVLYHNEMSVLAHNGVGMSFLYRQSYEEARTHFQIAGNRAYYSEAFWEIRNTWLQSHLPAVLTVLLICIITSAVVKRVDKQKRIKTAMAAIGEKASKIPVLGEALYFAKVPFHPVNCFYDIKVYKKGTVRGSALIYTVFFIVFMVFQTSKGFIFQSVRIEDMDVSAVVFGFFTILCFYVVCNYLMTAISDGEGKLADVFIYPAYSSFPLLMGMLIGLVFSYVLTLNEAFFFSFALLVGGAWSFITMLIGIQETHNYNTRTAIKSILLTLGFMLIIILMLLIIIVMWNQVSQFLITVVKEAYRNVFS